MIDIDKTVLDGTSRDADAIALHSIVMLSFCNNEQVASTTNSLQVIVSFSQYKNSRI